MTRLLEEAIEELRHLPEDEQDAAADVLFAYITSDERQYRLHPHQIAEVRRIWRPMPRSPQCARNPGYEAALHA
jgi:hypothetical protein